MFSVLGQSETDGFLLALICRSQLFLALTTSFKPKSLSLAGGRCDFRFYFFILLLFTIFLLSCQNLKLAVLPSQALSFCSHCWLSDVKSPRTLTQVMVGLGSPWAAQEMETSWPVSATRSWGGWRNTGITVKHREKKATGVKNAPRKIEKSVCKKDISAWGKQSCCSCKGSAEGQ